METYLRNVKSANEGLVSHSSIIREHHEEETRIIVADGVRRNNGSEVEEVVVCFLDFPQDSLERGVLHCVTEL